MGSYYEQCGLVLLLCIGIVFGSVCSPQNRTDDLGGCMTEIKSAMYNNDTFWYGTGYSTLCPNGFMSGAWCSNPSPGSGGLSLASRILPSSYDVNMLTKFVELKFTSDAGQYTGCGNTFTVRETTMFDIDPTSSQILRPWYVRHTPEMTWDSTPGEYYSLYVYDSGYFITHAVYINIQGNDVPTTEDNVIDMYHGPLISSSVHNVYVFMLFKQDGYLDPAKAQEWYNATHTPNTLSMASHIPDFVTLLNMTGPIGINWMVATGDEYASGIMRSRGILSTCPLFIGRALDKKTRPFLPNPISLSVRMDLTFQVTELGYTACCTNYKENARALTLNPIGNELLQSASTRSGLVQNVTFEKMGMLSMAKDFTGDRYTLIAMDPDVPSATAGTESLPLLHQMKINIVDGDFMTGEDVIPWSGPYPPNDEPHYYYFLLYKHAQPVTRQQMTSYDGDCSAGLAGRCLYDINRAVSENNFTLVGANWFRAVRDPYVRYRNIQRNPNVTEAQCMGQPGYTMNCETSGAPAVYVNRIILFIVSTFCAAIHLF